MTCPFPGMDPFLESPEHWELFHDSFVGMLAETLERGLSEHYRVQRGLRHYVHELVLFTSVEREEHQEAFLELRHFPSGRLVTLLEVVSPGNRLTATGRSTYTDQRERARLQGANVIEIDLLLQGKPIIDANTESLPEYDYVVCVSRARLSGKYELYTTTLAKRLSRIRVPLTSEERDLILDLQVLFARCYDQNFGDRVDYSKLPGSISEERKRVVEESLQEAGLR
jgi:hypothetical protein